MKKNYRSTNSNPTKKHASSVLILFGIIMLFGFCSESKDETQKAEITLSKSDSLLAERLTDTAITKLYIEWDWPAAKEAFIKALDLNPSLARAHAQYSWYLLLFDDWEAGSNQMKMAVEAEPTTPLWHAWYAWILVGQGKIENAENSVNNALKLDQENDVAYNVKGIIETVRGNYELAIRNQLKAAELNPRWKGDLAYINAFFGHGENAVELIDSLKLGNVNWNSYYIAKTYATLNNKEKAFSWLDKAFEMHHPYFPWIGIDTTFAPLWEDPRYDLIYMRLNLP